MLAYHDVDIQNCPMIQHSQIRSLLRGPPQVCQDRPYYGLESGTPARASRHLCQLGPDQVRSGFRAQKIAFALEMSQEAMSGTLVDSGLVANGFQTEADG